MCTAIGYRTKRFYFGRTLDLEYSYNEEVTVVPRKFPLPFRRGETRREHLAMIGMSFMKNGYPLFYDAANEAGLCMAGLNFPENARYAPERGGAENLAPYELIPRVLGSCRTLAEARALLENVCLAALPFSDDLPLTPLHFIVADRTGSLVAEPVEEGLRVYENPYGVLTNNPTFPMQEMRINDYMNLSARPAENAFSAALPLRAYSRGMGAMGLPGDYSSPSRFVRAAFVKENAVAGGEKDDEISQFFHMMDAVSVPRGCVRLADGKYAYTLYSSCCDTETGDYYYATYENRSLGCVSLSRENLDGDALVRYPLAKGQRVLHHN